MVPTFGPQNVTFWYPSTYTTNRCFFHDDGHYGVAICSGAVISIFHSTLTFSELYPETSLFVEIHFPPRPPCRICCLIKYICHHGVVVSVVDRVERFRFTLSFFDVSTAAWFTFSIPTSIFPWRVGIFSLFFLCCFYFLLNVHVNFYISTFVLSKLYSSFVHETFWPSEIYKWQPEFLCALLV